MRRVVMQSILASAVSVSYCKLTHTEIALCRERQFFSQCSSRKRSHKGGKGGQSLIWVFGWQKIIPPLLSHFFIYCVLSITTLILVPESEKKCPVNTLIWVFRFIIQNNPLKNHIACYLLYQEEKQMNVLLYHSIASLRVFLWKNKWWFRLAGLFFSDKYHSFRNIL